MMSNNKLPDYLIQFIRAKTANVNAEISGALNCFFLSQNLDPNDYMADLDNMTYKSKSGIGEKKEE